MKHLLFLIALSGALIVQAQDQLITNSYYYGKYKYKVDDEADTEDEFESMSTTYFEIVFTDSNTYEYSYSEELGVGHYRIEGDRIILTLDQLGREIVTFVREGDTLQYDAADEWVEEGEYYVFKGKSDGPSTNRVGVLHGEYELSVSGKKLKLTKITNDGSAVLTVKTN